MIKHYEKCVHHTLVYTAEFEIANPMSRQNDACSRAYILSSLASFGNTKLIHVTFWMNTLTQANMLVNI